MSPSAAYITYIPDSTALIREEQLLDEYQGEYIFILDRSGSMGGGRISQAKQSLKLFLKSLPSKSKFNVVSFGSNHKLMFPSSVNYDDDTLTKAINEI